MPSKNVGVRVIIDIVCCIIFGIPLLVLEFGNISPFRRGYFCDDDSIRLNYKDSTVPSGVLYAIGTALPVIAFLSVEGIRNRRGQLPPTTELNFFGYTVNRLAWAYYNAIFYFGFGCLCSQLVTDIGKYCVGRLRPNFLDACKSSHTCLPSEEHLYIVDYTCYGNPDKVKDGRLSFPSGHSSFAFYTMVYLCLYLQFRFRWRRSPLLRPFMQLIAILIAYYTALSRISDHKHHWSDVLGGGLLGTIVAFCICFAVSDLYTKKTVSKDSAMMPLRDHTAEEA